MIIIIPGILLGIICSLPVGQLGILSINRTLKYGFAAGYLVGATASILDAISCFAIMQGISVIFQIPPVKFMLQGVNILLLIYLGFKNILKKDTNKKSEKEKNLNGVTNQNILKTVLVVTVMFFSNTSLFILWGSIGNVIHSHSFLPGSGVENNLLLATGVAIGGLLLYFIILKGLHYNRHKIKPGLTNHLSKASGGLFFIFALGLFINLIKNL